MEQSTKRYRDPDWLREQYHEKQKTQSEIASDCGVSPSAIKKWMDKHGIETRSKSEIGQKEGPHTDEEWLREQYHGQGRSLQDMADECGVTYPTIISWMDKYEIERRERSEWALHTPACHGWSEGYEFCRSRKHEVKVHQLVAIANGADPYKLFDSEDRWHVHHKNDHPRDNRPGNIIVLTAQDHMSTVRGGKPKDHKAYYDPEWLEEMYVGRGFSTREVASKFPVDVSASTIQRWLSEEGIERRDKGRSPNQETP